jgi:lysophospholipase L1-like esterase
MKKPLKIVCLGDSLTYGYPFGPAFSWVNYVAQETGLKMVNAGVNGNTVEDMEKRFPTDVLPHYPDFVVILGGTNDAFCGEISIAESLHHLELIINYAIENQIKPILGLVPPVDEPRINPKLAALNSSYREIAKHRKIPLLDFETPFLDLSTGDLKTELYLDGVHPNEEGYRVMGKVAVDFFKTLFSRSCQD